MNNGMKYKARIEVSHDVEISFETPLFTGDIGNTIGLEFYLHGKPYKFTMATLFGTDATGDTIYSTSKAEVNEVVLPIVNEMYQVPGKADMQVVIYDDSENAITSAYLHFTVIKGLSENASIEGTEEYNSIMNLLVQVSSSMSQINRAEQAANEIESFLQLIKNPENSVVHQITESEIDDFTHGFAVVSAMESKESEGGPILTEYRYPLLAESEDLFGNVTVFQTRFFKGNLEQRVVGGEWNSLSVDLSDYVTESDLNRKLSSVYKYKGTVNHYTDLPKNAEIGDVYNIKTGYKLSKMLYPIQLVSVDGEPYEYVGVSILSCSSATILPEMVNCDVLLYDSKRKNISWNGRILSETTIEAFMNPNDFSPGIYYIEITNADFSQYYKEITFVEITAGDNVAWTGTDWDVLSGTIDTSNFATKEEVNILSSKLTSVYRYKGTVSHFSNLPSSPDVGDVYNIESEYHLSKEVKPITVTDVNTDEDYAYILVDPGTSMPPWAFNIDGINICDKNLNVISVAAITDMNQMRCEKDAAIEIGKQYYLEYFNITIEDLIYETGIVTVSVDINAGDNVAWTGSEWDRLAGTIDLSGYVTREELGNIEAALSRIEELQNGYIAGGE